MTPERSSRADQIRQKRQQSSQQRIDTVRSQATRVTGQNVSTTVRRTSSPYTIPVTHSSSRSSSVRKVHYAQAGNGVEVRLPALPNVSFNWQIASVFMAIAVLILVVLLCTLDTFQVKNVEVTGNSRVSAADIQAVVDGANHSIFTLDKRQTVNAILTAFPELTNIHLKLGFPDSVILTVTERKPIVAWQGPDSTQWIDAKGVIMPARGDGGTLLSISSSVKTPVLVTAADAAAAADESAVQDPNAEPKIDFIDPQVLQTAINLNTQLPAGASLVFDPLAGMGWKDPEGWEVFFGLDMQNFQEKLVEYQAIVAKLNSLGIRPTLISVEYLDAPYYRTE